VIPLSTNTMSARLFVSALSSTGCRTATAAFRGVSRPLSVVAAAPWQPILSGTARVFAPRHSASAGLTKEEVSKRILDGSKSCEKVHPSKLTETASFAKDLGLDGLDAVEVTLAIEEEFAIEIPDTETDEIETVQYAIRYISKTPEAY